MKGSQLTFNGGEFTEFMGSRVDTEKYGKGCRTMENMMPVPFGAALARPGTVLGGEAKYGTRKCRVERFSFSTSIAFDIEVGHLYFRFWRNRSLQLNVGSTTLEVVSPYDEAHLFELQFEQQNDIVYIVHPLYAPRKLIRNANNDWTLEVMDFSGGSDYPPLEPVNFRKSKKIEVIGSGSVAGDLLILTGDGMNFRAEDVGTVMMIGSDSKRTRKKKKVSALWTSEPLYVLGDWAFQTQGIGVYTVKIEESDDKVNWKVRRTYQVDGEVENVLTSGSEAEPTFFRMNITSYTSADATVIPYVILETVATFVPGLVHIDTYLSVSNSVVVTILRPIDNRGDPAGPDGPTFKTYKWARAYFSARNGWPRAICMHRNRLCLAANDVWISEVGNFENFRTRNDASGGFMVAVRGNGYPVVNWMESLRELRIGCFQGEAVVVPENEIEPFGSDNYRLRWDSNYGSKYMRAIPVNGTVFFVQPEGRTARYQVITGIEEFYDANSLTVLADHIMGSGIVQAGFQRQRYPTWYGVRTDGQLACLLFDQSQNIQAWYRITTDGAFESISITPRANSEDEVCVVVRRVINGVTKRFIEYFARGQYDILQSETLPDMVFSDCSKTVTGTAMVEVTGLSHLEGKTVAILADGAPLAEQVVSGGKITLDAAADKVTVGLPYDYNLSPMYLESVNIMGRSKSIGGAIIRLWRSGYGKVRVDGGKWNRINKPTSNFDLAPKLETGDSDKIQMDSDWGRNKGIEIRGRSPVPLNVQAITLEFDIGKG